MGTLKLNILDLLGKTLPETKAAIEAASLELGKLRFLDMLAEDHGPGEKAWGMNHGVYIFFSPEDGKHECSYVGQTLNQGFGERIGSHFGAKPKASRGNVYLQRTTARHNRRTGEKLELPDMIGRMHEHKLTLINVYWWGGIKERASQLARPVRLGHAFPGSKKYPGWGTTEFCLALERTLQAAYCPLDPDEGDHFLIMPKRDRKTFEDLHALRRAMEDDHREDNLAELVVFAQDFK